MLGGRTGNQVDHRYLGEEMSTRRLRLPANSNSDPDNNECEKDLKASRKLLPSSKEAVTRCEEEEYYGLLYTRGHSRVEKRSAYQRSIDFVGRSLCQTLIRWVVILITFP